MSKILLSIFINLFILNSLIFSQPPNPPDPPPRPDGVSVLLPDNSTTLDSMVTIKSGQSLTFTVNGSVYGSTKNYALWYQKDIGPWFDSTLEACPGYKYGPVIESFFKEAKSVTVTPSKSSVYMVIFSLDYNGSKIVGPCKWIYVNLDTVTNITEITDNLYRIYPNPAQDIVNVSFRFQDSGFKSELSIYDIRGNLVKQLSANNEQLKTIDISNLKGGIYFIKILNNKTSLIKKLVIY